MSLAYRKRKFDTSGKSNEIQFLISSLLGSLAVALLSLGAAALYSQYKTPIEKPLLFFSFAYPLISNITQQIFEILLSNNRFEIASALEICIPLVQIITYITLKHFYLFSLGVTVLISIIGSYLLTIILAGCYKLLPFHIDRNILKWNVFTKYWGEAFRYQPIILLFSVIDRIDKLAVLILFSTAEFAKYTLSTSIIILFRFVPESLGKLVVATRAKRLVGFTQSHLDLIMVGAVLISPIIGLASSKLIDMTLGDGWTISSYTVIAFALAEVLRHQLYLLINVTLATTNYEPNWGLFFAAVTVFFAVLFILISHLALLAIPISLIITYLALFYFSKRNARYRPSKVKTF